MKRTKRRRKRAKKVIKRGKEVRHADEVKQRKRKLKRELLKG